MAESGLTISTIDDVTVVDFSSAATLNTLGVRAVEDRLYALVDQQNCRKLLLDFREVRFLASQMLGVLVALHKKETNIDGAMVVCGLAANLSKVFRISQLDKVLHFARSVEEGLVFFRSGQEADLAEPPVSEKPWARAVKKQIRILFAGAMVLIPLAITVSIVWGLGAWLDDLGSSALTGLGLEWKVPPGLGVLILVGAIYAIGLLTHLWIFRAFFRLVERLVTNLPGAKTIYESVRDLMKLFGGDSEQMGRVVQYSVPGTDMAFLAILTNENPMGVPKDRPDRKVAIYVPYSYMLGGPTVFVSPEHLVDVDMSVEQCMKICAMAQVGNSEIPSSPRPQLEPPASAPTQADR